MQLFKTLILAGLQWSLLLVIRLALILIGLQAAAEVAPLAVQGVSNSDGRPTEPSVLARQP